MASAAVDELKGNGAVEIELERRGARVLGSLIEELTSEVLRFAREIAGLLIAELSLPVAETSEGAVVELKEGAMVD